MAWPPGYTRRPMRDPTSLGGNQASAPPVELSSKSRPAHCSSSSSCTQSASSPSGTSKSQSRQRWENQRRRGARCCRGQPLQEYRQHQVGGESRSPLSTFQSRGHGDTYRLASRRPISSIRAVIRMVLSRACLCGEKRQRLGLAAVRGRVGGSIVTPGWTLTLSLELPR